MKESKSDREREIDGGREGGGWREFNRRAEKERKKVPLADKN